MECLNLSGEDAAAATRERAVAVLRAGGVIVAPTETVYGLMTLWDNAAGRERIMLLKRRPPEKRLQMLAADLATAGRHGLAASPALSRLAGAFWPGPLTVVAPARGGGGTIGLRIPDHAFLRGVLVTLGLPLAATSANRSGEPAACAAAAAVAGLDGEPDLLIDGGAGQGTGGRASTVLSLVERPFRVLRVGPIGTAALRQVLGETVLDA